MPSFRVPPRAAVLLAAGAVLLLAAPAAAAPPDGSYRAAPGAPTAPAAAPAVARGRSYGGVTRRGDPLVLRLARDGRRLSQVVEAWRAPCRSGGTYSAMAASDASLRVGARGGFAGTRAVLEDLGGPYAEVAVSLHGSVRGRSASGSLRAVVVVRDADGGRLDRCALTTRFDVRSDPGRVYAGVTSQRGPVVLELAESPLRVRHLHIAWHASCTPQGWFQVGDTLERFPLARGRFGDDFKTIYRIPDGPAETSRYAVHGTVGPTLVRGRLRVRTVDTDASGATTARCDSGAIRFRAGSG